MIVSVLRSANVCVHNDPLRTVELMLTLVSLPTVCKLLSPETLLEVAIPVLACLVILCSSRTPGLDTTLLPVMLAIIQCE